MIGGDDTVLSDFKLGERSLSLSLMNRAQDEFNHQKPKLFPLKSLDIFGGAEPVSPIHASNLPDFADETPMMSADILNLRRARESSIVTEEKTIFNVDEHISKMDIDEYSFTAKIERVEIDENNDVNIYKEKRSLAPHQPARKSAFGNKLLLGAKPKSVTVDLETINYDRFISEGTSKRGLRRGNPTMDFERDDDLIQFSEA